MLTSKFVLFIILALSNFSQITLQNVDHSINKRFVLFPQYSVVQITAGLSVPAIFPRRSINLSLGFQMNHDLPWNLTNFQPLYGRNDVTNVDFDRTAMYEYVVQIIDAFGFDGEDCLLHTICQVAQDPIYNEETDQDGDNLLEQILHFLLTPSKDFGTFTNTSLEHKVLVAEQLGHVNGACAEVFSCPINLLDLFTNKFY